MKTESTVCDVGETTLLLSPRRNGGGTRGACDEQGGHLRVRTGASASESDEAKTAPSGLPAISPTAWGRVSESPARTFTRIVTIGNISKPGPTMRPGQ